jgi:hypothetical protein
MSWSVVIGLLTVTSTTAPPPLPAAAGSPVKPAATSAAPAPPPVAPPPGPGAPGKAAKPGSAKPVVAAGVVSKPSAFVRRQVRPPPPPPPEEESSPPPNVKLTIVAPSTRRLWAMRVENLEAVPVRLVADARLLSLDVTAPGSNEPVHCVLPADMRPADDEERGLVVPPNRAYAESFDPRLYCFGVHETPALTPGATVVAHLGWLVAPKHAHLRVVSPVEGITPEVGHAREIASPSFTIPADTVVPVTTATHPEATPADRPPKLVLALPPRLDVERPDDLNVSVRLANEGGRPVTLLFRSEVIDFVAVGERGGTRCSWSSRSDAPARELFTTLRPHETTTAEVLLPALCGGQFFDTPGLYVVRGELDTRRSSGAASGLTTFDGQVVAETPMLVRVRGSKDGKPRPRPHLE